MKYSRQIEEIVKYIKNGEKDIEEFKIGIEFEHFVVDKDTLETISYYGENGVSSTLKDLEKNGWNGTYEGEYILEVKKGDKVVTLEPGSQLEFSIEAKKHIKEIETEYLEFLREIVPILDSKNQELITIGYHPETKINDIKILPKKRYDLMFNYFKTKGSHAHNMMKGTAALQVSMDFKDEDDYKKKFYITNALSPILYSIFENALYFEGQRYNKHNLRAFIWENCDTDRSGIVEGALDKDFGYEKYAEYILNRPPIFMIKGGEVVATGDKLVKDIFNPDNYKIEELEHLLTMFFPDVRTKDYIEIRMMDSVPYPLNLSAVALLKGLLYNEDNLDSLFQYVSEITINDVNSTKFEMFDKGLSAKFKGKTILEVGKWLVELAKPTLSEDEKKYLLPLEGMLLEGKNPYELTKEKDKYGKKKAVNWCILNNAIEVI